MMPKVVEMTREESCDAGFDGGGLFLEVFLPWGKKKDQLRVGEGLKPFGEIAGVEEDVTPNRIFKGGKLPSRRFGAVTQNGNARRKNVIDGEGESGVGGQGWRSGP